MAWRNTYGSSLIQRILLTQGIDSVLNGMLKDQFHEKKKEKKKDRDIQISGFTLLPASQPARDDV
jgi:hypothetical protein